MKAFEPHFREAMRSRTALLDRIMHYIVKRKGKQMRPMFTLAQCTPVRTGER